MPAHTPWLVLLCITSLVCSNALANEVSLWRRVQSWIGNDEEQKVAMVHPAARTPVSSSSSSSIDALLQGSATPSSQRKLEEVRDKERQFTDALAMELRTKGRISRCWKDALAAVSSTCDVILATEATRSHLALQFTVCQLQEDGKMGDADASMLLRRCSTADPNSWATHHDEGISSCVALLGERYYLVYVQFRLHVDTLCFHAQEEQFQERSEAAVALLDFSTTATLHRLEEVQKHTVDVDSALDAITARQQSTMQSLHDAHKTMQQTANAHASVLEQLGNLSVQSVEHVQLLRDDLSSLTLQQRQSLQLMIQSMDDVLSSQRETLLSALNVSLVLQELAESSSLRMEDQRLLLEGLAQRSDVIVQRAVEHHERFASSHESMLQLLERVFVLQVSLVNNVAWIELSLFYFVLLITMLLFTIPQRTAAARFPLFVVIGVAASVEGTQPLLLRNITHALLDTLQSVLGAAGWWGHGTTSENHDQSPYDSSPSHFLTSYRRGVLWCCVFILTWAMCRFQSPEARQRQCLREELDRYWERDRVRQEQRALEWWAAFQQLAAAADCDEQSDVIEWTYSPPRERESVDSTE